MDFLKNKLHQLTHDESGQSLIEYSLIASIVAIGAMVAMYLMKAQIVAAFQKITAVLQLTNAG